MSCQGLLRYPRNLGSRGREPKVSVSVIRAPPDFLRTRPLQTKGELSVNSAEVLDPHRENVKADRSG